jgi:hypothetical protein
MKRAEIDFVVIYISSHGSFETKDEDFAGGAFAVETTEVSLYKENETFTVGALAKRLWEKFKATGGNTIPIQRNVCLILDACESGIRNISNSDSLPTSVFMRIASSQSHENARELVFAETFGKFVKNHEERWEADADEIDTFKGKFDGRRQTPDIIIPSCTGTSNIMWQFFGKSGSYYSPTDIGESVERLHQQRYGKNAGVPAAAAPAAPSAAVHAAAPAAVISTLDVAAAAARASVKAAAAVAAADAAATAAAAAAKAAAAAAVAAADASAAAKAASAAATAAAEAAAIASAAVSAAIAANAANST